MSGRREIFKLLSGEDIEGDQVNLGVTVLPGLRGGHFHNLARAVLNDNMAVLPQSGTLHREGVGGTGIGTVEGVFMLLKKRIILSIVLFVMESFCLNKNRNFVVLNQNTSNRCGEHPSTRKKKKKKKS